MSKLKKIIKSGFRKSNVKTFTFFLLFSTGIWLLVQFSQQYSKVVDIPIQYENFPKDKLIQQKSGVLKTQVRESGFELAWFKLFTPEIKIDLSQLSEKGNYLIYNADSQRNELERALNKDLRNYRFINPELKIPFQKKSIRRVPILPDTKISFASGYDSEKGLRLASDSVTISGPKKIIDSIKVIKTKPLKQKEINKDISGNIGLISPRKEVTLYQENIGYRLHTEKFTEDRLNIPIKLKNTPPNLNIKLFPPLISVIYKVSFEKYNKIQVSNFEIVCDYSKLKDHSEFLIPKLVKQPDGIKNVRLLPRKVQYIITQ